MLVGKLLVPAGLVARPLLASVFFDGCLCRTIYCSAWPSKSQVVASIWSSLS
jgi:pyruvate-formate lyase-activating enzyme